MRNLIATSLVLFLLSLSAIYGCEKRSDIPSGEGIIEVKGAQLYYKTIGEGEPIVILHGGPGLDHTYLLPQMRALSEHFELIFYDQRASGLSTGDVDSTSINMDQFVEDVESIRRHFKLAKMNLMGHSWGGLLAMNYAVKYPDNLKSLILISSAGASGESFVALAEIRQKRMIKEDGLALNGLMNSEAFKNSEPSAMQEFARITFKTYFYDRDLADSLTLEFNKRAAGNIMPIMNILSGYLMNYDLSESLSAIKCPTLIVHGDYDPIPPIYAEEIKEQIEGSELLILEKCGHFPFIESPELFFTGIRRFMEKVIG